MPESTSLIETVTAADLTGLPPASAPAVPPPAADPAPADTTAVPSAPAASAPVERDSLARPFDPAKFKREKDAVGRWKNLFAGRGGKNRAAAAPSDVPEIAPEAEPATPAGAKIAPVAPVDRFTLLADVYSRAGIAGAMGLFGEEWQPDDDSEFVALRDSVAAYLKATNQTDLSPGAALAFAILTYSAKRLPRPKTQSRLAFLREKLSAWWRGRRIARAVASMPSP